MDFYKELCQMRLNYAKKPPANESLPMPQWMTPNDGLYSIYTEKNELVRTGQIYYAYIVQANSYLFSLMPHFDLPASIIYSTEEAVAKNPVLLRNMGRYLYLLKDDPRQPPDEQFEEITRVIRDEYDRSSFKFRPLCADELGDMYFASLMVFRKHLPRRVLKGGIIPIIAAPEKCRAVMILPKRYWTRNFTKAWLEHFNDLLS